MDIEGWEWPALPDMIQSGALRNVKQLCLEVHFGYRLDYYTGKIGSTFLYATWGNVPIPDQLKILKQLHDYGFRIFLSDPIKNWAIWSVKKSSKKINTFVEISLVNINVVDERFHFLSRIL